MWPKNSPLCAMGMMIGFFNRPQSKVNPNDLKPLGE
jgi:hypothetical protein